MSYQREQIIFYLSRSIVLKSTDPLSNKVGSFSNGCLESLQPPLRRSRDTSNVPTGYPMGIHLRNAELLLFFGGISQVN